jgi:VWFA-related protein
MKSSTRRKTYWYAGVIAALNCLILVPTRPQHSEPEVKFTVRTELVLIPTLVTDKSGNHVTGLKKEDFSVMENGAEQKIATFEEITSNAHPLSRPEIPSAFSNSAAADPTARRITVIVLDLINTRILDQATARQELLKYLTQSVDEREPIGLYALTRSGIEVIHDFTTDPGILAAALHEVNGDPEQMVDRPEEAGSNSGSSKPGGGPANNGSGASSGHGSKEGSTQASVKSEASKLQSLAQETSLNFQSFEQRLAITYTLQGMQQIAQALAGFPGRKSLIWATGGFPFTVSGSMGIAPAGRDTLADILPLYEHTWQLLNDAQISLYPVDVRGLRVAVMPSASDSNVGAPNHNPHKNSAAHISRHIDTQTTFQTFASMTGGRAYYNSNDLIKGFRDAVSDSSEYYMLGYYLDHSKTTPGWRNLTVKVNREHSEVRARSGFFVTNATVDPENSRKADISSALQSPLDYSSLPLLARWDRIEPAKEPGKKHVTYEMRLSPDAGVIDRADNNHVVIDFVVLPVTPEGKPAGQPTGQKVDVHMTAEKLSLILQQGIIYNGALDLAPGEYIVRFVVRDDLRGRTGSVSGPLKVE